ncbi:hypothetical protein GRI89_10600 [Altererythrobacter salegens]|uniref:Uncharacterized protein n=1 Tax=Croceibacterium salegens TaxID=1737568 RepID=A0A6I4SXC7_9SPHN|nr:hypothetical protein [Croceibacterium salegens]MXO59989.1 hypothetical protein [Croceibacterium salegens]
MVRALIPLACMMLLSCAPDARSIKLTDVDLSDMDTVQGIRSQLSANDGAIFANYVVKHSLTSASFCGHPLVDPNGYPPKTVGEAIELTIVRDAEDRAERIAARRPKNSWELKQERWDDLVSERDMLIDSQSMLLAKHGSEAERLPEWKSIEARKVDLESRLREMKPTVFKS